MKNKVLSVIIPMYNSVPYIDKCLQSFVIDAEYMKQIEVIVVNDGSQDGCDQIVKAYAEKYPDIFKMISQENGGHGAAVDVGVEICLGQYFKIVDADDWVISENLPQYIDTLKQIKNADMVVCGYQQYDIRNEKYTSIGENKLKDIEYLTMCELMDRWKEYRDIFTIHGITYSTRFYKLYSVFLPHKVSYDDMIYITVAASMADKLCILNQKLYVYRVGDVEQSVSNASRVKKIKHMETVITELCRTSEYQRTEFGQAYWNYKVRSTISDFMITAFLRFHNKKEGRTVARKMKKMLTQEFPNVEKMISKRYWLLWLFSVLHVNETQMQKLMAFRARN